MLKEILQHGLKVFVSVFAILLSLTIFIIGLGILTPLISSETEELPTSYETIYGKHDAKHRIVVVPITGVILGSKSEVSSSSLLLADQFSFGYTIKDTLEKIAEDKSIDAIILDINSPGGTIYGAKAISDGVSNYREKTKKPVVAFVSGMAASGAYWAAAAADSIIADAGTGIGSIGVISGPYQYFDGVKAVDGGLLGQGVITENGISSTYITAGDSKDLGNPFRKLTKTELESLQQTVNHEYDRFVSHVASQRELDPEVIRHTIKALVYDPASAQSLGLIDSEGSREAAYAATAKLAGIADNEYQVVTEPDSSSWLTSLVSSLTGLKLPQAQAPANGAWCSRASLVLALHGDVANICHP